jgi:hypothetical protein
MSNAQLGAGGSDNLQDYDPDAPEFGGRTEWEDALIKHKIMAAPQKAGPTEDELQTATAEVINSIDKYESKSLDELDELEDELEDRVLAEYRSKRLAQLQDKQKTELFGTIPQIKEFEFIKEVSEASKEVTVVCHLFVYSKPECQLLNKCLEAVASRQKAIKFVKIIAQECIHNYPESNVPTLLIYKDGNILKQIVGLSEFGGLKMTDKTLEWVLASYKVLDSNLRNNPLQEQQRMKMNIKKGGISNRRNDHSSDEANSESD